MSSENIIIILNSEKILMKLSKDLIFFVKCLSSEAWPALHSEMFGEFFVNLSMVCGLKYNIMSNKMTYFLIFHLITRKFDLLIFYNMNITADVSRKKLYPLWYGLFPIHLETVTYCSFLSIPQIQSSILIEKMSLYSSY